jgi:hypothetical protein
MLYPVPGGIFSLKEPSAATGEEATTVPPFITRAEVTGVENIDKAAVPPTTCNSLVVALLPLLPEVGAPALLPQAVARAKMADNMCTLVRIRSSPSLRLPKQRLE